ncbi:MAG: APC family permease [Weissella hellenica]|uniref:APC family permease n=1 Tax=Weissella hellenica TaxID=46256 RepID=UPI003F9769C9
MGLFSNFMEREDASTYISKDSEMPRVLHTKDFLALGVGTIVSTAIFTLPGVVAAKYAGPGVVFSFLLAAVVAGFVALAYAEMASTLPVAGSAYSWINVLFGEGFGWIAGWALLAEYIIAVAFVGSGLSANFRGLLTQVNVELPPSLSGALDTHTLFGWSQAVSGPKGGVIDIVAFIAIGLVALLLSRGVHEASRIEVILVVVKVFAILLFIFVGLTAIHPENYSPFVPAYNPNGATMGGFQGIWAGVSGIFLAYIGFDSIASNSAEAVNPQKTMPRGILGSLLIAVTLFIGVSIVLVGMFKYTQYVDNAEPVGWALREAGHPIVAAVTSIIAVVGMVTALIGMMMAGSRLLYSFGRDGMLPKWLGKVTSDKGLPNRGLLVLTLIAIIVGSFFPFSFLSELISAGTLIAFIFVSLAMYALHKREGKDLPEAGFKMPGYPVTPAIGALLSVWVFWGISTEAKIYALVWFIVGIIVYFVYGARHSVLRNKTND